MSSVASEVGNTLRASSARLRSASAAPEAAIDDFASLLDRKADSAAPARSTESRSSNPSEPTAQVSRVEGSQSPKENAQQDRAPPEQAPNRAADATTGDAAAEPTITKPLGLAPTDTATPDREDDDAAAAPDIAGATPLPPQLAAIIQAPVVAAAPPTAAPADAAEALSAAWGVTAEQTRPAAAGPSSDTSSASQRMAADNPQPADLLADLPPLDPPASPAPVASAESDAATSTAVLSSPLAAAATAASVKPAARATEPDAKDGAKAPAAAPVVKPVPAQDRNESAAKSRPAKEPEGPAPAGADAEKPRFSLPAIASEPDLPPAAQAPPPAAARVGIDSSPGFGLAPLSAATTAAAQGATSPAAMPAVAVPLAGLAIEIAARARAGVNRFEIRLDPPELGRIDVRLEVARDGKATSHVTVDRPETLSLLQREQPQLERALEQAGLKTADNGLQFTLRDQSFAGRDGTGRQQTARLVVPDAALSPLDPAPTYSRLLGPGGLDIRV